MESLQRIYGISFPDAKMLKEWEKFQEEAKNRDHRKIGRVSVFLLMYFTNTVWLKPLNKKDLEYSVYMLPQSRRDTAVFLIRVAKLGNFLSKIIKNLKADNFSLNLFLL